MVVRDKKICKKLGLEAVEVSEVNNPYDPSGKLYRCASDIDFPIVHILPPSLGFSFGLVESGGGCSGEDDPLYPKMNLRDENPPDLDIKTTLIVRSYPNNYATDHPSQNTVNYTATWNVNGYYPSNGSAMSSNTLSSVRQWMANVLQGLLSTSGNLSPIDRITPKVDYNLRGNFCYVEAARLNKAEREFASYGFFCGAGSCPGSEECDLYLIKQTCEDCSGSGEEEICRTYDCSYCKGPVGDCSGCLEKQKEYLEALEKWQECAKRAGDFLMLVCQTAHAAYNQMVQTLSGEPASSPGMPSFMQ
ncbi:MAG: hypothetical protein QXY99_02715 [Thermoproteota archaeon]